MTVILFCSSANAANGKRDFAAVVHSHRSPRLTFFCAPHAHTRWAREVVRESDMEEAEKEVRSRSCLANTVTILGVFGARKQFVMFPESVDDATTATNTTRHHEHTLYNDRGCRKESEVTTNSKWVQVASTTMSVLGFDESGSQRNSDDEIEGDSYYCLHNKQSLSNSPEWRSGREGEREGGVRERGGRSEGEREGGVREKGEEIEDSEREELATDFKTAETGGGDGCFSTEGECHAREEREEGRGREGKDARYRNHVTESQGHMTDSSSHVRSGVGHVNNSRGHVTGRGDHATDSGGHVTGSGGRVTGRWEGVGVWLERLEDGSLRRHSVQEWPQWNRTETD